MILYQKATSMVLKQLVEKSGMTKWQLFIRPAC
jgi:hypothetical protein